MHPPIVACGRRSERGDVVARSLRMLAAQRFAPGGVAPRRTAENRVGERTERRRHVCGDGDFARAVVRQLARVGGDPHEARHGKRGGRSVAQLIVEFPANGQHDIGLLHRRCAHRTDVGRMVGRHEAPRFLRIEISRAARIEQRLQCGGRAHSAAAADDQRAPRSREQRRCVLDRLRVGQRTRRCTPRQVLGHRGRRGDQRSQHVGRDLDVRRTRQLTRAVRAGDGVVELAHDLVGDAQRARNARERAQDLDVRRALQRTHPVLPCRRTAADDEHRRALEIGIGHRRHAVGDAGTRRHERDAEFAGQQRMRGCHVDGGALVPHVDDRDAVRGEVIPDRLDMTALQSEHALRPARGEEARHPFGHGRRRRHSALRSVPPLGESRSA